MSESLLNELTGRRRLLTRHEERLPSTDGFVDELSAALGFADEADLEEQVARIRNHPGIEAVAVKLAKLGYALGPLPASYNPDPALRSGISVWVERDDDEVIIRLGVPDKTEIGEVLVEAARVLAILSGFPVAEESDEQGLLACEALATSYALQFAASFDMAQPTAQRLQLFGRRLQRLAATTGCGEWERREAAVWLWAYLTACAGTARPAVRHHVARFEPRVSILSRRLTARLSEGAPSDASEARRMADEIRRFLQERPQARCIGQKRAGRLAASGE